jgi:DNA-binding NarL/FixJ family response regulator
MDATGGSSCVPLTVRSPSTSGALLASAPEITVVGTAENGDAALAVVRREHPDVVHMDIRMPGRGGVSTTAAITADPALSGTRVIVLTTFDLDNYVHAALRARGERVPPQGCATDRSASSPTSGRRARLWSGDSSPPML